MSYARFAIYDVPLAGPLAEFGASWLRWDVVTGREVPQFDQPGLHDITMTPRKYGYRAPARAAELAHRCGAGLTARQDALLAAWGYPYVFEAFRFHLTLSGNLPDDGLSHWTQTLERALPDLPAPFVLDQIALCGEREDGRFELVHRYTLTG